MLTSLQSQSLAGSWQVRNSATLRLRLSALSCRLGSRDVWRKRLLLRLSLTQKRSTSLLST
ncbi:unnamed protein product [Linum tenue]|uniref:Uncharacterized protein n=1 Tax=Linum tenue TaxID=586396 RepID=A0AAV0NP20_9ROSI|nr:unnamed protein product [Linum tenue]